MIRKIFYCAMNLLLFNFEFVIIVKSFWIDDLSAVAIIITTTIIFKK